MGQKSRRESYSGPISTTGSYNTQHHSGPIPTTCSRNDQRHSGPISTCSHNDQYVQCHHHHHYYTQGQNRPLELDDKGDNIVSPFDKLEGLSQDDIRETAYEIFFISCRSSPGFSGRHPLSFNSKTHENGNGNGGKPSNVVMSPTSRVKRALGLKRASSRRMVSGGGGGTTPASGGSPMHYTIPPARPRRPMTSAELMRQQMKVTEHNDNRLRKTITRCLVGQVGKRVETIILPLELLRHLKSSEFSDSREYHMWQKRQLKILESGLLQYPSVTLEKSNTFAMRLKDIIRSGEAKPIDIGKNSDTMRTLCNSVVSLSWRSNNGTPTDVCHWADGYPLNIHLYAALLQAIFDFRDETLVLDEVDELLELIKKTWSTLGITRPIHNVCLTWVLFQQFIATRQVENDLLCASYAMLNEVANDAKREKESFYVKLWTSVLSSMQGWSEKRLFNYHYHFHRGSVGQIENLLPVVLSVSKILGEDLKIADEEEEGGEKGDITIVDSSGDRLDYYIQSTIKNAFDKVLQRAEKVEKVLIQMVVDDTREGDDNGKTVVKELVPYEVDSIILNLLREWIQESTWNPKSKLEPYALSAAELMKLAKTTVEKFFQIPIGNTEDLVPHLAEGLESLFQDYITFVASCGTKQSYVPSLPPLTRCNRDSKFSKLWKRTAPCGPSLSDLYHMHGTNEGHHPRPSTSRGTQRLYIRLNTLHYLHSLIHSLEKTLTQTQSPGVTVPSNRHRFATNRRSQSNSSLSYFETVNLAITEACQHVSQVAAYRLIFLDSNSTFYDSLYVGDVDNTRIRPALRILKQNITLMTAILADKAQPLAMKEVMKATFDAFLMVLLAGGSSRAFNRLDHVMIQEDFESLNRVFCTCDEGLIAENVVEREAAVVEGVIALMGQSTEQLVEDFSIVTCETSGKGMMGSEPKLPMPPTTGRWNRSDPNTILRVLCHRNDRTANNFLKRAFQLAKRRS
ncbi:unnamed protein product [Lupinus luteus]|uniref:Uncharacterized protein n=1 Tax=Lupinus luteus TaxID=3873 RepID=A0AAV1Y374_LUPLU